MLAYCKKLKRQLLTEADCLLCENCEGYVLPEVLLDKSHKNYSIFHEGFYELDNLLLHLYNVISEYERPVKPEIKEIYKDIYNTIEECFKYLKDCLIETSEEQ